MKNMKNRGFTLVEVLIVVVIMAILAATIIPQFSDSSKDAKNSSATFNLHTIRSQVELYKSQHDGVLPGAALNELTVNTNKTGTVGTGTNFPYGPYVRTLPSNPFNNLAVVKAPAAVPPTAVVDGAGWLYDAASGKVWINEATMLSE